ncbi:MAG: ubiquinone biosynthesis regulatory protein kinase UbiB [Arenimonas sp.]|nr:ubiquinone biosynthesis regulatory protein kinase UbiB [Arenimonas sp.]
MSSILRAFKIARIASNYGLEEWIPDPRLKPVLHVLKFISPTQKQNKNLSRGARLRLALQQLGPLFVKFGQVLSTRRDLLPADIADELAGLRDQVKPFDSALARQMIEKAFNKPIAEVFARFDDEALASASIAQVHAAQLADGREVVVKVLRPNIAKQIAQDIALMRLLATWVNRLHPHADKLRAQDVVNELESTLLAECDLQCEAANASLMHRLWQHSTELEVPEVMWSLTFPDVMTQQRVYGIPADHIAELDRLGIDRKALASTAVRILYQQVFRDNYFHADAHAGNIWIDISKPERPNFIALDFGIVGQLSEQDQYYLAENFMAIFHKDYHKIAKLHVQAGWMPSHMRLDELEAAVRSVCEPYFTRPLAEFSIAEVVTKLFRTAQKYELTLQPQLILLQKTLLNTEGLARTLDPEIDLWAVARPVLEEILRERYSPKAFVAKLQKQWPELVHQASDLPELLKQVLQQQAQGQSKMLMRSEELADLVKASHRNQRQLFGLVFGFTAGLAACALFIVYRQDVWTWVAAGISLLGFASAWPRKL